MNALPKVIILRSHFPDVRANKVFEILKEEYDVEVLAWCRGVCEGEEGVSLFRFPLTWQSFLIFAILPFFQLWLFIKIMQKKPDVIHAADFDTIIPAVICGKILRSIIIYDIYDYYSEMIELDNQMVKSLIKTIDDSIIKRVNHIIIPDENRVEQIGVENQSWTVIYNTPMKPSQESTFNDNPFSIFFGGYVSKDRGIDELCSAVRGLERIKLKIVGNTSNEFKDYLFNKYGSDENIEFQLTRVDHESILDMTSRAQLIPVLYSSVISNNRYSSPNKFFEALSFGVPTLIYENSSIDLKAKRHDTGIAVSQNDVLAIRKAILTLRDNKDRWFELRENSLRVYDTDYSWETMKTRVVELYRSLLN